MEGFDKAEPIQEKGLQAVCDLGAQRQFCFCTSRAQRGAEDLEPRVPENSEGSPWYQGTEDWTRWGQ